MSKYTTEVRYICENAAGYNESKGFDDIDTIIEAAVPNIFNFDFPIFDPTYKNVICSKILMHYYTREIGLETVGLWKLKLRTKLNEVMPYYNQLYNSELIKFNPLYDTDLETTHIGDKQSEANKSESRTGETSTDNERIENESFNKNDSYSKTEIKNDKESKTGNNAVDGTVVEGENRSGDNRTDGNNVTVGNIENEKTSSGSNSGNTERTKVNASNYTDSEDNENYDLYSDTPQGALNGVENETYLTNARKITDEKSKNGKKDDTEILNEKNGGSNSSSESDKNNSTTVAQDNIRASFTEQGEKSNVKNEKSQYDETNDRNSVVNSNDTNDSTGSNNKNIVDVANRNESEILSGTNNISSTESYILHVVGKQSGQSFSKMLKEFRETFLNIDMEVIDSLSDLFMNVW